MAGQLAPKAGRNDLCPCGSGKKYKKCCLNKQSVPDNSPATQIVNAQNSAFEELAKFLTRRFRDEFLSAWTDYLFADEDDEDVPDPDEEHEVLFMAYALLHWDPDSPDRTTNLVDGGLVVRTFLHERSHRLKETERQLLEILMRQPFSFYEVVSYPPGENFQMRELWTGQEITVSKQGTDEDMTAGEILYAQMLPMPGVTVIALMAPIAVAAEMKPAVLEYRDVLREDLEGGPRDLTLDDVREQQDELRDLYFEILDGRDVDDDEEEFDDLPDETISEIEAEAKENPELRDQIRAALQETVDNWPHQQLPALGNKTPLEAMKEADNRTIVESLVANYQRSLEENFSPIICPNLEHVRKMLDL